MKTTHAALLSTIATLLASCPPPAAPAAPYHAALTRWLAGESAADLDAELGGAQGLDDARTAPGGEVLFSDPVMMLWLRAADDEDGVDMSEGDLREEMRQASLHSLPWHEYVRLVGRYTLAERVGDDAEMRDVRRALGWS